MFTHHCSEVFIIIDLGTRLWTLCLRVEGGLTVCMRFGFKPASFRGSLSSFSCSSSVSSMQVDLSAIEEQQAKLESFHEDDALDGATAANARDARASALLDSIVRKRVDANGKLCAIERFPFGTLRKHRDLGVYGCAANVSNRRQCAVHRPAREFQHRL